MMSRTVAVVALAVVGASWAGDSTAADRLTCRSASAVECSAAGCERQDLHSDLTVDLGRKSMKYCAGAGCFDAVVAVVKTEDGSVSFAFDARSEQGRRGGRVDRLVTIHPGGKTATIGAFLADGTVLFSPMECQAFPPAQEGGRGAQSAQGIEDKLALDTGSTIRAAELERRAIAPISVAVGQSKPDQRGQVALTKAVAWLKAHPDRKATLAGHADDPGSDEYNLALGDKRAAAVRAAMVAQGIAADRLTTITFGRLRPLSPDGGHNGRVEIILGE
jgi:outer membrane protein OmpA-like peptidoglycan-associated protein